MLGGPTAARHPFGAYSIARARRLLMPWLVWSVVYGGVKLAEALVEGQPLGSAFAPWMLLTGPAIHLWFLPFAFAASLVLPGLMRISPQIRQGPLLVLCGGAALATLALAQAPPCPRPWRSGARRCPLSASASGLRWRQSGRAP